MEAQTRQDFIDRCERVAEVARQAGVTVSKSARGFGIVLSRGPSSATFPIVSDERDWRQTSANEALYSAVIDSFAWASTRPNEAAMVLLDSLEQTEVPRIKQDLDAEMQRVRAMAEVMGGFDTVRKLWKAAGIDPAAAAGVSFD